MCSFSLWSSRGDGKACFLYALLNKQTSICSSAAHSLHIVCMCDGEQEGCVYIMVRVTEPRTEILLYLSICQCAPRTHNVQLATWPPRRSHRRISKPSSVIPGIFQASLISLLCQNATLPAEPSANTRARTRTPSSRLLCFSFDNQLLLNT